MSYYASLEVRGTANSLWQTSPYCFKYLTTAAQHTVCGHDLLHTTVLMHGNEIWYADDL